MITLQDTVRLLKFYKRKDSMCKRGLNTQTSSGANVTQRAWLLDIKSVCPASPEMC
jgi:hypothetical protein